LESLAGEEILLENKIDWQSRKPKPDAECYRLHMNQSAEERIAENSQEAATNFSTS